MDDSLALRLRALSPIISDIIKVSGAPGSSIGVLHRGKFFYTEGFGFCDVENQLVPNEDTIFYLASLSKTFTAAMVAILVEREKLNWTTPLREVLPNFRHWDDTVQQNATVVDFLSHRSGLAAKNEVWSLEYGQAAMGPQETLPMVNTLEKVFDLGHGYQYNNWGYAVADQAITAICGDSWGTALRKNIFEPLGMYRTVTSNDSELNNRAEPYQALSNGTLRHLGTRPQLEDGRIMQGANGVQSCVRDLLVYYKALFEATDDQTRHNRTSTPNNPLVQVPAMLQAHSKMFELASGHENSYALGWARTELPAPLGSIGLNPTYVPEMPQVGEGLSERKLCLWHQGSSLCNLNFVALLPDTRTAILVLSNGLANNDVSDWIGQLLLEAVLDNPKKTDYLEQAKLSAKNSNARWPQMKADLEKERTLGTDPLPLETYVGQFSNKINTFSLHVRLQGEQLQLCFQGGRDFWYPLQHYEYDVFTWVLTRDEMVQYGRFPVTRSSFHKIKFLRNGDGTIGSLIWAHDGTWPAGETFQRTIASPADHAATAKKQ